MVQAKDTIEKQQKGQDQESQRARRVVDGELESRLDGGMPNDIQKREHERRRAGLGRAGREDSMGGMDGLVYTNAFAAAGKWREWVVCPGVAFVVVVHATARCADQGAGGMTTTTKCTLRPSCTPHSAQAEADDIGHDGKEALSTRFIHNAWTRTETETAGDGKEKERDRERGRTAMGGREVEGQATNQGSTKGSGRFPMRRHESCVGIVVLEETEEGAEGAGMYVHGESAAVLGVDAHEQTGSRFEDALLERKLHEYVPEFESRLARLAREPYHDDRILRSRQENGPLRGEYLCIGMRRSSEYSTVLEGLEEEDLDCWLGIPAMRWREDRVLGFMVRDDLDERGVRKVPAAVAGPHCAKPPRTQMLEIELGVSRFPAVPRAGEEHLQPIADTWQAVDGRRVRAGLDLREVLRNRQAGRSVAGRACTQRISTLRRRRPQEAAPRSSPIDNARYSGGQSQESYASELHSMATERLERARRMAPTRAIRFTGCMTVRSTGGREDMNQDS
ncbi:hypothetical protein C8R45DRAFT_945524 [Mycena sanguinolenta]|nr:hypothetical protein C8R45DRAFT_945524 [Mycena sanguinolenta]